MSEVETTAPEKPKQSSWTKRHQGALAILGAVLATTSYFGKDYALARWSDRASSIKAARANDDAVNNTTSLDQRIGGIQRDLGVLVEDALAMEEHRRPRAQSDRFDSTKPASLGSRSLMVSTTLRTCQQRLMSLGALDKATDPNSPHRDELKSLLEDANKKLTSANRVVIDSMVSSNPSLFGPSSSSARDQEVQNGQMELLENQTDKMEARTAQLATIVRDDAERQRERYVSAMDSGLRWFCPWCLCWGCCLVWLGS